MPFSKVILYLLKRPKIISLFLGNRKNSAQLEQPAPLLKNLKISEKLSALVNYCESVKFKGFDSPRQYWQMSSLDETKAAQLYLVKSSADKFVAHNRRYLSRIYPRGTRVLSSNYDPIPLWLAGCQMVALNYQAQDKPLAYNRALFRCNGQCGYVLKPEHLLKGIYYVHVSFSCASGAQNEIELTQNNPALCCIEKFAH